MTKDDRITCAVCAWRGTCAKKFSISAKDLIHCIDFTRDVSIKYIPDDDDEFDVVPKPVDVPKEENDEDTYNEDPAEEDEEQE